MNNPSGFKTALLACILVLTSCQAVNSSPAPVLTDTATPFPLPSATPMPTPTETLVPTPTLAPESDFIKGAWFVDWGLGPGVDTRDGTQVLEEIIVPLGANWIALAGDCRMDVRDPSAIKCNYNKELYDLNIQRVTQKAHSLGLRVALFPVALDVEGVMDNWSANLDYGNDQGKWDAFFTAYSAHLLHYAALAEENQIDLLMLGGEQTGSQKQEAHWRSIIEQVRAVYHGPITYEAWCFTSESVKWWDAVDYIGNNFYCSPLADNANPTDEEVKQGYLGWLKLVRDQTSTWNKPVIFTEIGYASIDGAAMLAGMGIKPVHLDVEEQGILVKNFFEALKEFGNEDGWLKGLFWYEFSSSPTLGGMGDLNFTPHNKPAEVWLKAFYTGQEPGPMPTLPAQVDETELVDSFWVFSDKMENDAHFGPWDGNGKSRITPDPLKERGDVIQVDVPGRWDGIHLVIPGIVDFRNYDALELYIYVPATEPNLEIWFSNASGSTERPYLYIRSFMDHEPLVDNHWHRISIPVSLLFPPNRRDKNSRVESIYLMHMWPGNEQYLMFYIDDVRLVKTKK